MLGFRKSLLRDPDDNDRLDPLKEGLLEEEVDRELALVEVLVLDRDRELDLAGWGVLTSISMLIMSAGALGFWRFFS